MVSVNVSELDYKGLSHFLSQPRLWNSF